MTAVAQFFQGSMNIPNFAEALERALNPYESVSLRVPFYLTSSLREKQKKGSGVTMLVNPKSVQFSSSKRITKRDTQGGSVMIHWTDRLGRNNDVLTMEFSGQTGNINIRYGGYQKGGALNEASGRINMGVDSINQQMARDISARDSAIGIQQAGVTKNTAGVSKLANFHNLHSLTREPVRDPTTGAPVNYYIMYSSPAFGNMVVTFVGYFNRPLEFQDAAEPTPFNIQYSFGFTALASHPSLDYIYSAMTTSLSREFMNNLGN